jgi:hypothetical protein
MNKDLAKNELYEGVKQLVELESTNQILLNQQKLYTLFSLAFQYMLFRSGKNPGAYIIRIEDAQLGEKLARKAKDPTSRKFLQALLLPRKLKVANSVFYLDFFHFGTWNLTNDIPKDKIQAALVVRDSNPRPMNAVLEAQDDEEMLQFSQNFPADYYYQSLKEFVPKILLIDIFTTDSELTPCHFAFIKKDKERSFQGVTINEDIDID